MSRSPLLLASAAAAIASLAVSVGPSVEAQPDHHEQGRSCFWLRNIQGSKLADPRNYYIRAEGGRVFHLAFGADCATAHTYPLIVSSTDNSGQICDAIGMDIRVRDTGERCMIKSLTLLSPDEAAALPPNARP